MCACGGGAGGGGERETALASPGAGQTALAPLREFRCIKCPVNPYFQRGVGKGEPLIYHYSII